MYNSSKNSFFFAIILTEADLERESIYSCIGVRLDWRKRILPDFLIKLKESLIQLSVISRPVLPPSVVISV